jgi:hypothetical protein
MTAGITFVVEDDAVLRKLRATADDLEHLITALAEQAADDLRLEGGHVASHLAAPWEIEGFGDAERRVVAPVWWAHFLAGGTQAHGPVSAGKLVFQVAGEMVFADYVGGISATHFDEAALNRTRSHVDEIARRIVG